MLFQMVIGALGIFPHRFFLQTNFIIFPQFSAISIFLLYGNPILSWDLVSSSNFTSIIVVRIFFFIFFHFCIIEKTQDSKMTKNPCLRKQGQTTQRKNNFCILCFLDYTKVKKNSKKYTHHYNRCKIRRGIQIRTENWVAMQRKAGKCRKLSKNYKIACRKKRCGKIPSAPTTILKSIKKDNFWRLIDVLKPASVLVITVFLFSVF